MQCVLSSFVVILMGKRPLIALFGLPGVMRLIVFCSSFSRFHGLVGAVPDYTHLLIWSYSKIEIDFEGIDKRISYPQEVILALTCFRMSTAWKSIISSSPYLQHMNDIGTLVL